MALDRTHSCSSTTCTLIAFSADSHFDLLLQHVADVNYHLVNRTRIQDSSIDLPGGYRFRSSLRVKDASFTDTGYYVCHHAGKEEELNDLNDVAKTYVYVEGIVFNREVRLCFY